MPRLSKIGAAALAAFGWTGLSSVTASYLQVAGGGGGGNGGSQVNGGGGAGGLLSGTVSLNPTQSYTVVVGAGGAPSSNGTNSQFGTLTASVGGGNGAVNAFPTAVTGGSGGSGGGGAYGDTGSGISGSGGSATSGQGNIGSFGFNNPGVSGCGGGGGGSATAATNATSTTAGLGGNGTVSSISGTSVTYAGGGGGGGFSGQTAAGSGGTGGGGAGGVTSAAISGTANLGGGGGGSGYTSGVGGQGGSGVVIISYPSPQKFGGGIVTTSGSNTIHTFTTSGTLSPLSTLTTNFLVVAGGGGGGGTYAGGGGGAGGFRTGTGTIIDTNSTYIVTVGSGGAGGVSTSGVAGSQGGSSSVFGTTSAGGGGGGTNSPNAAGTNGGSGGGGVAQATTAGLGNTPATSPSQGNNGGTGVAGTNGSGGGGAGAVGGQTSNPDVGGNGGAGAASSISGASVTYAGGGGGGGISGGGTGGAGGGGNGSSGAGSAGTANLGGGGGGSDRSPASAGGAGGSGIVIISYAGSTQLMAGGTVTISGGNVIHTFTSSGYLAPLKFVGNSLRFRGSNSAYLSRTPTTASNRRTWTWSGWVKRGTLGAVYPSLFMGGTGLSDAGSSAIIFNADAISFGGYNTYWRTTSAVYRDPAAWYHIVVALDTTQATAANRVLIYVNGVQVTAFATNNTITQNADFGINQAALHEIGYQTAAWGLNYFDGEMTEVNFIDGQALTPNSFGTFNQYGVWQPIRYGGSYGTNGFYLPFTANTESFAGFFGGSGYSIETTATQIIPATGDFTVEAFINFGSLATYPVIACQGTAGVSGRSIFLVYADGSLKFENNLSSISSAVGAIATNRWYYVAVTRSGANSVLYINGVQVATNSTTLGTIQNTTFRIGVDFSSDYISSGYVSNVRVSNTVRTISPSTAPTTNFTNDASTVLLTLQGATVVDNSSNAYALTNNGPVTTGKTYPFAYKVFNDQSPQGNNWTPNNISGITGSTLDYMTDVPTLTSTTAANYCVMNPLTTGSFTTLSGANLNTFGNTSSNNGNTRSTFAMQTGKWYIETTLTAASVGTYPQFGIMTTADGNRPNNGAPQAGYTSGSVNPTQSVVYLANGNKQTSSIEYAYGASFTNGDVVGIAIDSDNGAIYFSKNGVFQNSGVPTSGATKTGAALTWTGGTVEHVFSIADYNGSATATNFGQRPFTYTAPSGFLPLNTFNL